MATKKLDIFETIKFLVTLLTLVVLIYQIKHLRREEKKIDNELDANNPTQSTSSYLGFGLFSNH